MNVVTIVVVKVFAHIIELNQDVENVMVVVFANIVVEDLDVLNAVKKNTYVRIINKKLFVKNAVDHRYALIININKGVRNVINL